MSLQGRTSEEPLSAVLDDKQINTFWKRYAPQLYTDGYLESDSKLSRLQPHKIYLINTAKHSESEGEHWVCIVTIDTNHLYYFDPIGYDPLCKYWKIQFLNRLELQRHNIILISPKKNYMLPTGTVCGEYVCLFGLIANKLFEKGQLSQLLEISFNPFAEINVYPANFIHSVNLKNDATILTTYKLLTSK